MSTTNYSCAVQYYGAIVVYCTVYWL